MDVSTSLENVDERIVAALAAAREQGEEAVQVAAWVDGHLVVDAAVGDPRPGSGASADSGTLFPIFSVTKAVTCLALHLQADRGLVEVDAPVSRYWPEFAAHGKEAITVRHVLTHRSGLPQMPPRVTPERMGDWDWMVEQLADLEPLAAPGSISTYQALSFGWLVGEVVRRTDPSGRTFGGFVRDELFDPIGVDDLWLGLPEEHDGRVATLVAQEGLKGTPSELRQLAVPAAVDTVPQVWNQAVVQRACIPGAGAIANARSVARAFTVLAGLGQVDGVRLLREETIRALTEPRPDPHAVDGVIGYAPLVGVGGFWLGGSPPAAEPVIGARPTVLCHPGSGGSIGWADPEIGLAAAVLHNRMFSRSAALEPGRQPFQALGDALREIAVELR